MKPHHTLALLIAAAIPALSSCSSSPSPASSGGPGRAKPGSVVDEQIVELGGKQFRQRRVVITTEPYETRTEVVPVN
jgi:hypothetical protein